MTVKARPAAAGVSESAPQKSRSQASQAVLPLSARYHQQLLDQPRTRVCPSDARMPGCTSGCQAVPPGCQAVLSESSGDYQQLLDCQSLPARNQYARLYFQNRLGRFPEVVFVQFEQSCNAEIASFQECVNGPAIEQSNFNLLVDRKFLRPLITYC